MKIAGINRTSLVDSPGISYVIFTQGCPHKCEGCHNPSTWKADGGYEVTLDELKADILSASIVNRVVFSGGEPVNQPVDVLKLAQWCKQRGLQTTLYTGYVVTKFDQGLFWTMDYDVRAKINPKYLQYFDYIIDGTFDISQKTLDLPFRGSSNQRILKKGVDY
jgi:anaerobic ribonucleoside-triphosphate reductase activating protein